MRRNRPIRDISLRRVAVALAACFCLLIPHNPAQAQFWKPVTLAAQPGRVTALAVDPRNDSNVYLAAPGGGIWKSTDGGQFRWIPLFDAAYSLQVCSLAIDSTSPDVMYAGTGDDQSPRPAQGVARSADGGQTWNIGVRFTNQPVCVLAVDPADGSHLLAGSSEGLFASRNSGATWQKVLAYPVTSAVFDGMGNIYAGQLGLDKTGFRDQVLVRSADGGRTWTNLSLPVPSSTPFGPTRSVSVLARGNTLYAAVSYHVSQAFETGAQAATMVMDFYRSADAGVTWSVASGIGETAPPVKIFTDAAGKNLYVTGTKIQFSQDQGNTWTALRSSGSQFHDGVFTGGLVLVGGELGLNMLLPTPAQSNEIVLPGIALGQFLDVAVDSSGNRWGAGPAGLFGSAVVGVNGSGTGSVVAATANSRNVFAAGNLSVYRSTDGTTFTATAVIPSTEMRAPYPPLVLTPNNAATAFVAGQQLYRTTNSGTSWAAFAPIDPNQNNVVTALTISPAGGRVMYAATACLMAPNSASCSGNSTIWQSTNAGQTWTQKSTVLGLVNRLTTDPRVTNTVYAAVGAYPGGPSTTAGYSGGNLLRSVDNGVTWVSVLGNLPQVAINTMVIDPTSAAGVIIGPPMPGQPFQPPQIQVAQTLYVGTDAGVFVSFNAGTYWTGISSSLPPSPVTQLSLQQPAATLEAATFGRGIYQASVAGLSASLIANPLSAKVTLLQGSSSNVVVTLANISTVSQNWQMTPLDPWIIVQQGAGTVATGVSSSVTFQISSAGLPVGTYLGRLKIATPTLEQQILVSLQVTTPPASLTIVSGNNATGRTGATLPPFVVALLDATGSPVPGVPVRFAITSGTGSLSSRTDITDAGGQASTAVTLPSNAGNVEVTATAGNLSVSFTATAVLIVPPSLMSNSVVNGVTFNSGTPPAPGSIIAIFGQNLSTSNGSAASFPLPTSLAGTNVLLETPAGEIQLPLFYVSPLQINAMMPFEVAPGTYTLFVQANSILSNAVQVSVSAFSPGIFTLNSTGQGMGVFVKPDGSIAGITNPVAPGSVVSLYATGLGAVNPPLASGLPGAGSEPLNRTVQTPVVFFDTLQAQVLYSGLAPGFAGLYQVNVRVPSQLSSATNIPVSMSIGGIASNRVAVPVR